MHRRLHPIPGSSLSAASLLCRSALRAAPKENRWRSTGSRLPIPASPSRTRAGPGRMGPPGPLPASPDSSCFPFYPLDEDSLREALVQTLCWSPWPQQVLPSNPSADSSLARAKSSQKESLKGHGERGAQPPAPAGSPCLSHWSMHTTYMPATTGHQAESAPGQPPTLDLNFVSQALIGSCCMPWTEGPDDLGF